MITNAFHKPSVWKVIAMFVMILGLVSSLHVTSTSAASLQDTLSPEELIRQDMHNIAYLYANHAWSASYRNFITYYQNWLPDNIPYLLRFEDHSPYRLLEFNGDVKYFNNINGPDGNTLNLTDMTNNPVNTPHVGSETFPDGWVVPDELLFDIGSEFIGDLNSGATTDALVNEFMDNSFAEN